MLKKSKSFAMAFVLFCSGLIFSMSPVQAAVDDAEFNQLSRAEFSANACCNYGNESPNNVLIDNKNVWHSDWSSSQSNSHNHYLEIDLGEVYNDISRISYLARQDDSINGNLKKFDIYASDSPIGRDYSNATLVGRGEFEVFAQNNREIWQTASFSPATAQYIQIYYTEAGTTESNQNKYASCAQINISTSDTFKINKTDLKNAIISGKEHLLTLEGKAYLRLNDIIIGAQALIDDDFIIQETIDAAVKAITNFGPTNYDSFTPSELWLDDTGEHIQAHGGGILYNEKDNRYYWYGEDKTLATNHSAPSLGVHVYSSADLYNWKDEGVCLPTFNNTLFDSGNKSNWNDFMENRQTDLPEDTQLYISDETSGSNPKLESHGITSENIAQLNALYKDKTVAQKKYLYRWLNRNTITERPKVIYNDATEKYVMWFHDDGGTSEKDYSTARAAVAISDSPAGPFELLECYRVNYLPGASNDAGMARDLGLFKDDDDFAYLFTSSENNVTMIITKLSSDYTTFQSIELNNDPIGEIGVDFQRVHINGDRESPAVFKNDGKYYLITSGLTGWNPNPASVAVADDIFGPYIAKGNPTTGINPSNGQGPNTTFGGQNTFVLPLRDKNGKLIDGKFIFMADIWKPTALYDSRHVWLPIEFKPLGNSPITIEYKDSWTIDFLTYTPIEPSVITITGVAPVLPSVVNIKNELTNEIMTEAVTWESIAPSSYKTPGTFRVKGTIESLNRTVMANVLVEGVAGDKTSPYTKLIGEVIWVGDSQIENHQGSNGDPDATKNFGNLKDNYNPKTIGWFFERGATNINKRYLEALDGTTDNWGGYINVEIDVLEESVYQLNILAFGDGNNRRYDVVVNGLLQGTTDKIIADPASDDVYTQSGTNNVLNVLQHDVILNKGKNIIKLQAPTGTAGPNFVAMAVIGRQEAKPSLVREIKWAFENSNDNFIINNGSSGINEIRGYGSLISEKYDSNTIGWFFPNVGSSISKRTIGGLDNAGSGQWSGSLTIKANVPLSDMYMINILCTTGDSNERLYDVNVNGQSQGVTDIIKNDGSGVELYTDTSGNNLGILQKSVKLEKGENIIKLQAPTGYTGPEFLAMAVVGYEIISKPTGNVIWAEDFEAEIRQGSDGSLYLGESFGNMQNYSEETIGLFFDKDTSEIIAGQINALDDSNNFWQGYLNLNYNADEEDVYKLSILCSSGSAGRRFGVTVNGVYQGQTDGAITDASDKSVYSTRTGYVLNVLQMEIPLSKGKNLIRLQAIDGLNAPDFVAAYVSEHGKTQKENLVPNESETLLPNYVCTWTYQDWAKKFLNSPNNHQRDVIDHEGLFGENGFAVTQFPDVRKDLILLLDDGWELPYYNGNGDNFDANYGGQIIFDDKFPGYGATPEEKLTTMVENIESLGWGGAGIWVAAQENRENQGKGWNEPYWRERIEWSKTAGVAYWKIDWGQHIGDHGWRQLITNLVNEIYPELVVEHIIGAGSINSNNNRVYPDSMLNSAYMASYSDVFRTYDVVGQMGLATTLDRVAEQLFLSYTDGKQLGLMNAEDEVYMEAALGMSMGIMRYSIGDLDMNDSPNAHGDPRFTKTRPFRKMMDEVSRAVKWQRIAPPFRVDAYETELANEYFADDWYFYPGDSWDGSLNNHTIVQRAPALVARGVALPSVTVESGDRPYVIASRNPNGAISIATFGRTHNDIGYQPVKDAKIQLNAGDLTGMIGVFGYYGELELSFNQSLEGKTILAQDLLSDFSKDITSQVTINGNTLTISGELLEQIGLGYASDGDYSEPGLVLQIGQSEDFVSPPPINKDYQKPWDLLNDSFEKVNYDINGADYGERTSNFLPVGWKVSNTDNSYVQDGGHLGNYEAIHAGEGNFEISTSQERTNLPDGIYKLSLWVKSSTFSRADNPAGLLVKNHGGENLVVDIQAMANEAGGFSQWTKIELNDIPVSSNNISIEINTIGAGNEYLIFDDVIVESVRIFPISAIKLDGINLSGFNGGKTDYEYLIYNDIDAKIPVITVEAAYDGVEYDIKLPESIPGKATITVASPDNENIVYTINFGYTNILTTYASDLPWVSSTTGWGGHPTQRDKSIEGNPITTRMDVNDTLHVFSKGIGTHANSTTVIDIQGKGFERFQTYVGLDRETKDYGSVVFQISIDGVTKFTSGAMTNETDAVFVDLDVTNAKTITLYVGDGGDGNSGDHGDFADAKFILERTSPIKEYIKFTVDGEEINEIIAGSKLNVSSELSPVEESTQTLFVALYNNKGVLIKYAQKNGVVLPNEMVGFDIDFDIPADLENGATMKVFVWDENYIPLREQLLFPSVK